MMSEDELIDRINAISTDWNWTENKDGKFRFEGSFGWILSNDFESGANKVYEMMNANEPIIHRPQLEEVQERTEPLEGINDLIFRLKHMATYRGDIESKHLEADALLLEFIADNRVTEAFWAFEKWYS